MSDRLGTMRVIIVDDEPAGRRMLRECCAAHVDLEIAGEFADPGKALAAIRADPPQLLFLDIRMDTMSGLDLARSLPPTQLPSIVFVTAYDQYAVDAFELSAADYLLKPFDEERFARMLERVRERRRSQSLADREAALTRLMERLETGARIAEAAPTRLIAESHGRAHVLDPARIELVKADRNYVRIYVGGEIYHSRSTLEQAERALAAQPVLRISRSCLVNMSHVREVSRTPRGDFILVLAGGTTVTSSEGFRNRVRDYLERLRL